MARLLEGVERRPREALLEAVKICRQLQRIGPIFLSSRILGPAFAATKSMY